MEFLALAFAILSQNLILLGFLRIAIYKKLVLGIPEITAGFAYMFIYTILTKDDVFYGRFVIFVTVVLMILHVDFTGTITMRT